MGTCYSSKSKSASQPYSSAPMSTSSSQDSSLRLPRPTPYARGGNQSSGDTTFKRCIPPPTKYRAGQVADRYVPPVALNTSQMPRVPATSSSRSRTPLNDNRVMTEPASDNNNFVESNPTRDFTTFKREILDRSTVDAANNRLDPPTGPENMDQARIQYGTTKIPTKITAHLSGLPKPQVAVVTSRVAPLARNANEREGLAIEKQASSCPQRISPDKESISNRSHSGDSGSTDYDSGLGHSLSDQPLADEHTLKGTGDAANQEDAHLVADKIDKVTAGIKRVTVGTELAGHTDSATSRTGFYNQPDSYAAYRGILSYRRIAPLKKCPEVPPPWKKSAVEESKVRASPTKAVIAKGILTKGAKAGTHSAKEPEATLKSVVPLSPTKEEKEAEQEGGFMSPTSDGFLIDDDISDQPGLIALERSRGGRVAPLVKRSIYELHALQSFGGRDNRGSLDSHPLCSDAGSSCSSLGSDDLMLDFDTPSKDASEVSSSPKVKYNSTPLRRLSRTHSTEKRHSWESNHSDEGGALRRGSESLVSRWALKTPAGPLEGRPRTISLPLRPPRQMVMQECDDGGVKLDSSSYRSVCQDLNGLKTMLLKLKRVLQDAETLNPFELTNTKNLFYHALARSDLPTGFTSTPTGDTPEFHPVDTSEIVQENMDLKRQLILMQQQMEDKDRTIHLLQQQMTKYMNISDAEKEPGKANAAVQTERPKFLQNTSCSSEDSSSSGRLVSSKMKTAFEEVITKNSVCHASLRNKMEDVSKSLCSITQALRQHSSKPRGLNRSRSNWELLS